jgi:adenine/guanine phosphoribosyltransferase-like PRPP-binding protein
LIAALVVIGAIIAIVLAVRARKAREVAETSVALSTSQAAVALAECTRDVPPLSDHRAFDLWIQLIETRDGALTAAIAAVGIDANGESPAAAVGVARDDLMRSVEDYRNMGRITPPVTAEQSTYAVATIHIHADKLREAAVALEQAVTPPEPPRP